jgi:hypothetical protein
MSAGTSPKFEMAAVYFPARDLMKAAYIDEFDSCVNLKRSKEAAHANRLDRRL